MSIFDFLKKRNNSAKTEIARLMKNAIVMDVDKCASGLRPDTCKIGGKPYLPADFTWPTFTNKEDGVTRPLSFFCQLNLSELSSYDVEKQLPSQGLLSFFYECESSRWGFDPDDKGAARVYYFEDMTNFVEFDLPKDLDKDYRMPEIGVRFQQVKSYPMFEEFDVLSDVEGDWEEYDEILEELGVDTEELERHKILGYADTIQGEMLSECERASRGLYCGDPESYQNTPEDVSADINKEAKEWTLLLQLGTISKGKFEWMFGDCGMIYYYIKKGDLAEKRFDKMWFSVQCG